MGAGRYVGRIGGLAVALGIGSALLTGPGVAAAEPADTSTAESSASESSTTDSADSTADSTTATTDDSTDDTDDTGASSNDDDDEKDTAAEPRRSNKRWKAEQEHEPSAADRETETETETETEDTSPVVEPAAAEPEPEPATGVAPVVVEQPEPAQPEPAQDEPESEPAPEPKDAVATTVSSVVSALASPFAGEDDEPVAPAATPLAWTLAAAARREAGLVAVAEEPDAVVARPVTPLLTPLQHVPILGPLLVTPVVAAIKQVPFIGDILHPIIGYPIGFTGGTTPRDVKVISADGTAIYVHFFPAQGVNTGKVAPTILNGPGLGLPGETNPLAVDNPFMPNQVIGMAPLLQSGYNVVTWDPRGEWQSGGVLQIDHPDFEGQDMKAIISWLAEQPEVQLDAPGDPRIGMVGASYGGGIQLVTAAIDKRVDAIAPTIAWNNLNTSLFKAESIKTSWGALLSVALLFTGARVNPQIYTAVATGLFTGALTAQQQAFLDERSPDRLLDQITAPTLLLQGTVDTLFSLQEAHDNAMVLIANGVPTKVVWFCGGHGACISSGNDGTLVERATMDWLDKYVMGLPVSTGPRFEWVDQHGREFASDTYPVEPGPSLDVVTDSEQTLPLWLLLGGSGPNFRALQAGPIGALLGILSAGDAPNAVEVTLPEQLTTQYLVGAPQLEFTYSGRGASKHVYAQLVDDTTGLVLGNQVTPIPVTLDGEQHVAKVSLEQIAHTLEPGQTVTLQIVASAVQYQAFWSSGRITVSSIKLAVPTASAAAVISPQAGPQTVEVTTAA